jgi:hypothetical protein
MKSKEGDPFWSDKTGCLKGSLEREGPVTSGEAAWSDASDLKDEDGPCESSFNAEGKETIEEKVMTEETS